MNVQVNGVILYYEKQGSGPPLTSRMIRWCCSTAMGRMDAFSTVPQKYWPLITPSTPLTAAATAKAAAMCP